MKTYSSSPNVERAWHLIDAEGEILGRLATQIATLLQGKHKPIYSPYSDTGDHVVVVNSAKVAIKGNNKSQDKTYYHHTGYPGGIKSITFDKLLDKKPNEILELAVKRMLPKGPLGRQMFSKLKVYAGGEHPHQAQNPTTIEK